MNMTKLLLVVCFVSFICSVSYAQPSIQILEVFSQRVKLKVLNATDPLTIVWGDSSKTVIDPDTVWVNSAVEEGMVITVSDSNGSESVTVNRLLKSSGAFDTQKLDKVKTLLGPFNFYNKVVYADSLQSGAKIKTFYYYFLTPPPGQWTHGITVYIQEWDQRYNRWDGFWHTTLPRTDMIEKEYVGDQGFVAFERMLPDSIARMADTKLADGDSLRIRLLVDARMDPFKLPIDTNGEFFAGFGYVSRPEKPLVEANISVLNPDEPVELQKHIIGWNLTNEPGMPTVYGVTDHSGDSPGIVLPADTTDAAFHTISLPDTFYIPFHLKLWAYSWDAFFGLDSDTVFVEAKKGVAEELPPTPQAFELYQNYPNPFKPETTIQFDLSEPAGVTFKIYNLRGQNIRTLLHNVEYDAGSHPILWNGTDDAGNRLASGIYFYRIKAGSVGKVKKLILTK